MIQLPETETIQEIVGTCEYTGGTPQWENLEEINELNVPWLKEKPADWILSSISLASVHSEL